MTAKNVYGTKSEEAGIDPQLLVAALSGHREKHGSVTEPKHWLTVGERRMDVRQLYEEANMVAITGTLIFAGSFMAALLVIIGTIAPQWGRILATLDGSNQIPARPLQQLVLAERRIAVMRWSAGSRPATVLAPTLLNAAA